MRIFSSLKLAIAAGALALLAFAPATRANNTSSCVTGGTTITAVLNEINNCILTQGSANLTNAQLNAITRDMVNLISPATLFGYVGQGYVVSNVSSLSSPPTANPMTTVLDAAFGSNSGEILYRGTTSWQALQPGSSGQVLTTQGSLAPQWGSVSGTGTVTSVGAGAGLAGGPVTGSGSLTLDWTYSGQPGKSQTVKSGPVNTSGYPNFLPSTAASLSITGQNISSSVPLVMNAWAAPDANGIHSIACALTSAPTWGSLAGGSTNFLYATLSTTAGVCTATPRSTTSIPLYEFGGTPSVSAGQITCNIGQQQCYLGNGSAAVQTAIVIVGEAVTNSTAVTSTVLYAYNGYYDSGYTATLPTTSVSTTLSANIGVPEVVVSLSVKNTTAEFGYSIGDVVTNTSSRGASGNDTATVTYSTRNAVGFTTGSISAFEIIHKTSGVLEELTLANWSYRVTEQRPW